MKPSLIFIHGFRGNGLGLKELSKNFRGYDVSVLQIPPAGGNTLREFNAKNYARFVADYIKKNQIKKPVLIGHSMGSIVAAAVAERYPDLIADKIVFLAPISVRPNKFFAALTPLSTVLPNRLIGYLTTKYMFVPKDQALFKKTLETTYTCGADFTTKKDVYKSAKFSVSYAICDFSLGEKSALFLSGEADRLMPRKKTEKVARSFKNAKTVYLKNCGHLLNYESPKEVAKEIKKFLK